MAHIIFLNLPAQIKVCSATGVLRWGYFSLRSSLPYVILHRGSLWFLMCNLSTIFCTLNHIKLYGSGKGNCFLATRSLSKLHILSYETTTSSHWLSGMPSILLRRYWRVIRKTCPWPSELRKFTNNSLVEQKEDVRWIKKTMPEVVQLFSFTSMHTFVL